MWYSHGSPVCLLDFLRFCCFTLQVRMMNEILNCIKLIKMYAWEKSFAKAISGMCMYCCAV